MAEVHVKLKELIPTAKFANVEIDLEIQGEASEIVELSKNGELVEALNKAYDDADEVLQAKRTPIIEELEKGNL